MANKPLNAQQFAPCDTPQEPPGRSSIDALPRTSAVAVLGVGAADGKIGAPQRRPAAKASLYPTYLSGQPEVPWPPGSSVLCRHHHSGEGKQSVAGRRGNIQVIIGGVVVPSDNETHALRRSVVPPDSQISAQILRRRGPRIALVLLIVTVLSAGVSLAPSALADSAASLRGAVASARAGTSCGPFRPNPVVDQAAEKITRSVTDYLDHTATQVPIEEPLPGLKILGYPGSKATALQGAGKTEANAIKGALVAGYGKIPDCSYTDYGASMLRNERTGWYLTAAVLAGA